MQIRYTPYNAFNDQFEGRVRISENFARQYWEAKIKPVLTGQLENTLDLVDQARPYGELSAAERAHFESPLQYATWCKAGRSMLETLLYEYYANFDIEKFGNMIEDEFFRNHSKKLGALSLAETSDNEPNWAHYASEGAGYLIGIDPELQAVEDHKWKSASQKFGKINYVTESPALEDLDDHEVSDLAMMYTKTRRWSYEEEWRMLDRLENGRLADRNDAKGYPVHLFELKPLAIREVVFGYSISPDTEAKLTKALSQDRLSHVVKKKIEINTKERKFTIRAF